MNTIVPSFFTKNILEAEKARNKPNSDEELVYLDPKMLNLIKAFKISKHGKKSGGLS